MTEAEGDAVAAENASLRQPVQQLQQRIAELEQRQAKDSQTSHKPPASDGLAKKTRSLRQPSGKHPGGKWGIKAGFIGWLPHRMSSSRCIR